MINPKTLGFALSIAAVIAWNTVSSAVAYRAGRNATVGRELAELRENLVNAITRHQENLEKYDALALEYAQSTAREQAQINQLETALHEHISSLRGTCRLDPRSLQLINAAAAASAEHKPAPRGDGRTHPVPRPTVTHGR